MNMKSVTILKIAVIFCALLVIGLAVAAPWLIGWYASIRHTRPESAAILMVCFYICVVPALAAMGFLYRLVRNIERREPFSAGSITCLKAISWCCLAVSAVCVVAGFPFPPLFFVSLSMAFLFIVVRVVCGCFSTAAKIKEENDLTV